MHDLAEKYTSDKEYEEGTIMCIGGHETTKSCNVGIVNQLQVLYQILMKLLNELFVKVQVLMLH